MKKIRGLIIDMDGVLWRANHPIGDLASIFDSLSKSNIRYVFATNNSTLSVDAYWKKLRNFGIYVDRSQIITSAVATANYISKNYKRSAKVYVIGEKGLVESLSGKMIDIVGTEPDLVVVGMDRKFNYAKLKLATIFIRSGALFIGTNPDKTFPADNEIHPGTGSILAAIEAATDTVPFIIGKPYPTLYEMALNILTTEKRETLVIGDRLETDIKGANELGIQTALVLSGVTEIESAQKYEGTIDIIANNLSEIVQQIL